MAQISSADSGHEGLTTGATQYSESTTAGDKITTQPRTDSLANSLKYLTVTIREAASSPSATPSRQNELQTEQDNALQNASQYGLLQVAISSLIVLAMVCITVCAIIVTVFIMACKRNRAQITYSQGRYISSLKPWKHTVRLQKSKSTLSWISSSITVLLRIVL